MTVFFSYSTKLMAVMLLAHGSMKFVPCVTHKKNVRCVGKVVKICDGKVVKNFKNGQNLLLKEVMLVDTL